MSVAARSMLLISSGRSGSKQSRSRVQGSGLVAPSKRTIGLSTQDTCASRRSARVCTPSKRDSTDRSMDAAADCISDCREMSPRRACPRLAESRPSAPRPSAPRPSAPFPSAAELAAVPPGGSVARMASMRCPASTSPASCASIRSKVRRKGDRTSLGADAAYACMSACSLRKGALSWYGKQGAAPCALESPLAVRLTLAGTVAPVTPAGLRISAAGAPKGKPPPCAPGRSVAGGRDTTAPARGVGFAAAAVAAPRADACSPGNAPPRPALDPNIVGRDAESKVDGPGTDEPNIGAGGAAAVGAETGALTLGVRVAGAAAGTGAGAAAQAPGGGAVGGAAVGGAAAGARAATAGPANWLRACASSCRITSSNRGLSSAAAFTIFSRAASSAVRPLTVRIPTPAPALSSSATQSSHPSDAA
jgi:hypothetical protein